MPKTDIHTADSTVDMLLRHRHFIWWLCLRHALGEVAYGGDLVQEVFAVLSRCHPQLPPDASPRVERAWLRTATRNVLNHLSRRPVVPTVPLTTKHDHAEDDGYRRRHELVDELAAYLDDDEHQLLQLHLDGFSNDEIAIILGIKTDAVRQRMHRIVGKMRATYEKLYNTHIQ